MEYCKLCEKAVGSKERRILASISSERVLRCLQELQAASGSTATLLGDEHAQRAFVCRPCFAETEKYLRLSEEVERVRNSLWEKLFTKFVLHVIFDVSAPKFPYSRQILSVFRRISRVLQSDWRRRNLKSLHNFRIRVAPDPNFAQGRLGSGLQTRWSGIFGPIPWLASTHLEYFWPIRSPLDHVLTKPRVSLVREDIGDDSQTFFYESCICHRTGSQSWTIHNPRKNAYTLRFLPIQLHVRGSCVVSEDT